MPVEATVALVTGAYYPEISSGGNQCRAVARVLAGRIRFTVVTTAVDRSLPRESDVDGVRVYRLPIDVNSWWSRFLAAVALVRVFLRVGRQIQIVHLHGVSSKNVLATWLARLVGARVVLTLHTAGQDEPDAVRARSGAQYRSLRRADRVLSVSPLLTARYRAAGLPADRLAETFNGIDTDRFRPASDAERQALRGELGLPGGPIVLFVGFFSRDKRPDLLFEAWTRAARAAGQPPALVCVGAAASPYFEVDAGLAGRMEAEAQRLGLREHLRFIAPTNDVDKYFRAADVFALPSVREAMPMALLEAMACGLACIASRLPGATDVVIAEGINGWLVPAGDPDALATALCGVLQDPAAAARAGAAARRTIEERFAVGRAAGDWLAAYRHVLGAS
jgi:glycosyltransferase involved in cell wall biosynthesis